ncbi:hypothetical protein N9B60_02600 [Mariniblastus sp.]|nr:hypothetical protein [Mariniblastus sp.]MDB4380025.1 hypothetical protein [Mariniblastus sp.]|tara:strand:+ start:449 stop:970 length:522 start_codon:yes stop_codon:yes gene_type:complete
MTFLNPKRWNVACWLLLLLWLCLSVLMNAPIEPKLDGWESSGELADGSRFAAYDPTFLIGWPFAYLQIAIKEPRPSVRTYIPMMGVYNFILVAATLISLVYAVQNWIPQFSIRTILICVAVVAVLIVTGQAVLATEHYGLQTGFMTAVYFSPIVAALAYSGYDRMRRRKTNAG